MAQLPLGIIKIPSTGYVNQSIENLSSIIGYGGTCKIRYDGKRYFFRNTQVLEGAKWIRSITAHIVANTISGNVEVTREIPITDVIPNYGNSGWLHKDGWVYFTIDSVAPNFESANASFDVTLFTMIDKVTINVPASFYSMDFNYVADIYFTVEGVTECVAGEGYTGQAHQSRYSEWANVANRATLADNVLATNMTNGSKGNFHEHGLYCVTINLNASAIGPGLEHLVTFTVFVPEGWNGNNLSSSVSVANGSTLYWLELEGFEVSKVMSHDMNLGTLNNEDGWTLVKAECIQFA